MTGHQLINHLSVGDSFEGIYYVENVFVKKTVHQKDYSDFTLRDKSGNRNVKFWGVVDDVKKGDFVFVAGNVEEYMGNPSIVAKNAEKADAPADLADYIPVFDDSDDMANRFDKVREQLEQLEQTIGDGTAGSVVNEVYGNAKFFEKFIIAPGSARPHYGRQGGLMASTVRIAEGCLKVAGQYDLAVQEQVILIASALLCRAGAIEAYEFQDCMPVQTKMGILLGINTLTTTRMQAAIKRAAKALSEQGKQVNQEILVRILHVVTSHNALSVLPKTKEALVLHSVWKTDADLVDAIDFIANDTNTSEEFTAYDPAMRRQYYRG